MTAQGHTSAVPMRDIQSTATLTIVLPEAHNELRYFQSHPVLRRVAYVAGYEGLSVLFTVVVMSGLLGHGGSESTLLAVMLSTVATIWNYLWNTLFEAYERRTGATGRGIAARVTHALGYEGGVLVVTIPMVSLMLGVTLWEAAMIEIALLVFFLIFTAVYAFVFDRIFGLPASAMNR